MSGPVRYSLWTHREVTSFLYLPISPLTCPPSLPQLESFSRLLRSHPAETSDLRLVLVGGCRGPEDRARVDALTARAAALGISDRLELRVNVSYEELMGLYSEALIGLHTMKDEHFGIGEGPM